MPLPEYWDAIGGLFVLVALAHAVRGWRQAGGRRTVRLWLAASCLCWSVASFAVGRVGLGAGAWPATAALGCAVGAGVAAMRRQPDDRSAAGPRNRRGPSLRG
jgi:hypothetical protein